MLVGFLKEVDCKRTTTPLYLNFQKLPVSKQRTSVMKSLLLIPITLLLTLQLPLRGQSSLFIEIPSEEIEKSLQHISATADGGLLLHIQTRPPLDDFPPQSTLAKLNAEGVTEWWRSYRTAEISVEFNDVFQTTDGSIYQCGLSTKEYPSSPLLTKFTPHGIPLWSLDLTSAKERSSGLFTQGRTTLDDYVVVQGSLFIDSSRDHNDFHTINILSVLSPSGDIIWTKWMSSFSYPDLNYQDSYIGTPRERILIATPINYGGYCTDRPFSLTTLSSEGHLLKSEQLYERKGRENPNAYLSTEILGVLSDSARSIVYGNLKTSTVTEQNDPKSMPRYFTTEKCGFLLALDRDQNILWSRKIDIESSNWKGALQEDGSVVLSVGHVNDYRKGGWAEVFSEVFSKDTTVRIVEPRVGKSGKAKIFHFDPDGNLLRSYQLTYDPSSNSRESANQPADNDKQVFSLSSITTTGPNRIAAAYQLQSSTTSGIQTLSSGLLEFDLSFPPLCISVEPLMVEVTPLEFIQEPFEVEVRNFDGLEVVPFVLNEESTTLETRDICSSIFPTGNSEAKQQDESGLTLELLPSSLQAGRSGMLTFTSDSFPTITLTNASSGKRIRQLPVSEINYSQTEGKGSATINTTGLVPGIYLVEVEAGSLKGVAKLRVEN